MDKVFIFLLCFYFCSAKITINKLDVPPPILYGSQDDVILDCDFDSGGDPVDEIKWFINGDTQIYQWLPMTNTTARAIGKLRNHIDITHKATNDALSMYRALHLTDLSPEVSGNYTCKVSGPMSEDQKTKSLIVYVIPDHFDYDDEFDDEGFLELVDSEETSEISCSAEGFYPRPNLSLYISNDNESGIVLRQENETVSIDEDGLYNVSAVLKYDVSTVNKNFNFTCELTLPGTLYSIRADGFHSAEDIIEVEEDFSNSTNSTESSFEGSTESASVKDLPSLLPLVLVAALGLY